MTWDLFAQSFDLLPAAAYACEAPGGAITAYNRRAVALWGSEPQQGATDARFCGAFKLYRADGSVVPPDRTPMADALRDGIPIRDHEMEIERPDGSHIVVLVNIDPIRNDRGAVTGAVNIFHDITELRQTQRQVERLNAELEQRVLERTRQLTISNSELQAFAYSVSHDLRAPLRAINGLSQTLSTDCADQLDDHGRRLLDRVRAAGTNMSELLQSLLDLSRLTMNPLRRELVDMSAMAHSVAADLRATNTQREVHFVIRHGVVGYGDARLLRVMLTNLLDNAWKYTGKRVTAKIEFGLMEHENQRVYFVRDDGAGFDMTESGKLFSAFHRLHSESEFEGTGIGLATVSRIVHRHGGRIWAESAVGRGASFYFTLAT